MLHTFEFPVDGLTDPEELRVGWAGARRVRVSMNNTALTSLWFQVKGLRSDSDWVTFQAGETAEFMAEFGKGFFGDAQLIGYIQTVDPDSLAPSGSATFRQVED